MKETTGHVAIEGIKRCYVEGSEIIVMCPECKNEIRETSNENYISYPQVGKDTTFSVFCETCDDWYSVAGKVKSATITIEYDPAKVERG